MKKELILSSLILMNPVGFLQAEDIELAHTRAVISQDQMVQMMFESRDQYLVERYYYNEELAEYEKKQVWARYHISFIPAEDGNYTYWHEDYQFTSETGLDYEVIIKEEVDGEITTYSDSTYYAKHLGGRKYQLYDCDSTSSCAEDYRNTTFYIFPTPKGHVLKIKDSREVFTGEQKAKIFYESVSNESR